MKNVESTRASDGAVTLTSRVSNIKIDKLTPYVLERETPAGQLTGKPPSKGVVYS